MQTYFKIEDRLINIGNDILHMKGDIIEIIGADYIVEEIISTYELTGNHSYARCVRVIYELSIIDYGETRDLPKSSR